MSHPRTELRANVRAALSAAFPDVDWAKDYWRTITPKQLPRGGVGTPRTSHDWIDLDTKEAAVDLLVVLKRAGAADLEDLLDGDSEGLEAAVLPVLAEVSDDFDLTETRIDADPGGEETIGELHMRFRVVLRAEI
ncbi:hypothetical protein [Shimia sp.]|uniref:hypothetical protein n=1 Tax=Shimia sp. TaxID=1954381 RepID=UPI003B8C0DE3